MIRKISIKNFSSFKNKTELKLKVDVNAPGLDNFYQNEKGERFPKVLSIFGHNGSGKTNLVKALAFLRYYILASSAIKLDEEIPFDVFSFGLIKNEVAEFEIEFEVNGEVFDYQLSLSKSKVIKEELQRKNPKKIIFSREGKNIESPFKELERLTGILSEKVSVISFCNNNGFEVPSIEPVIKYFLSWSSNIVRSGRVTLTRSLAESIYQTTEWYIKLNGIKEKATKLLSQFDLGIVNVEFKKIPMDNGANIEEKYIPILTHSTDGQNKLSIFQESSGTQSLYVLLFDILKVLEQGGVAIIDELDAYLHSHMLRKFLELFYDSETNPHNAQLFFSCHADYIMSYLEKEQVILCEKDKDCVSTAYLISDLKGVRRDDNLRNKYNAGAYGGIPVEV